jgi:hypothetical protein
LVPALGNYRPTVLLQPGQVLEPSSHSQSYQRNSNTLSDFNSQSRKSENLKNNPNNFFKRNKDSYLIEGESEKDESFNKPRFRKTENMRSKSKSKTKKKSPFRSKSVKRSK